MFKLRNITLSLIALFLISTSRIAIADNASRIVSSRDLKATTITAVMDSKIEPGRNAVFCSAFQMAWNVLCNGILKAALELSDAPEYAKSLNALISGKPLVSEDAYLAMAGFGKDDIVKKINEALAKKFGKDAPTVSEKLKPTDILAYAFLYKNLQFAKEFEGLDTLFFNSGEKSLKVDSFGIRKFEPGKSEHDLLNKQVDILYCDDNGKFIIRLASKSPDDEIIISTVKAEATLGESYAAVKKLCDNATVSKLAKDDKLQIPKVDFNLLHTFGELIGKPLRNKGFEEYIISKALQSIRFVLNEKGAILKSEAKIVMTKTAMISGRRFVANSPFFIFLKNKAAESPYFALYVDNDELLIKK
ncbi:MAG TPA: hypothetical protein PKK26_00885 [Candidatus Wallbacteria bacterium]|nr:hypothetical protein [Candidatus Wallbacteria bacterium]